MIEFKRKVILVRDGQADQMTNVLDLRGLGAKHFMPKVMKYLSKLSSVTQAYYPEILGRMVILYCPLFFFAIWKVIRGWLDERVANKIVLVRGPGTDVLHRYISTSDESLPAMLGGKCCCTCGTGDYKEGCFKASPITLRYDDICQKGLSPEWIAIWQPEMDRMREKFGRNSCD